MLHLAIGDLWWSLYALVRLGTLAVEFMSRATLTSFVLDFCSSKNSVLTGVAHHQGLTERMIGEHSVQYSLEQLVKRLWDCLVCDDTKNLILNTEPNNPFFKKKISYKLWPTWGKGAVCPDILKWASLFPQCTDSLVYGYFVTPHFAGRHSVASMATIVTWQHHSCNFTVG